MNGYIRDVMIDAAAHATGQDPVAYRLKLLAGDPRSANVVRRAATLAGWGHAPQGRFQGIAFVQSDFYATRIAVVVEVAKSSEGIRVTRAFAACDSGLAINPMLCEHCIEGGIIFGLSNAMFEEVTLTDGAADQKNFNDYRLMRMNEAPDVQVEIISVGETPGSIGEIGTFPVGAALSNALFQANGQRYRAQPFAKNGVKFARDRCASLPPHVATARSPCSLGRLWPSAAPRRRTMRTTRQSDPRSIFSTASRKTGRRWLSRAFEPNRSTA
jgi:isoquinoline 1-oxidoreductase beta subunit